MMTPVDGSIAIGGGTAVTPEGDTEVGRGIDNGGRIRGHCE